MAKARRDRLRSQGRCIWCNDLLVYPDSPAVLQGLALPNHTLAPRLIRGIQKLSDRCDSCRQKEKIRRGIRDDRGSTEREASPNGSPASVYVQEPANRESSGIGGDSQDK